MSKKQKTNSISHQSELMQHILEVRYTDIDEEKRLCKQLLDISEAEQYFYGSAFANVYLVDSHLALGEYSSCDFYLLRASFLCEEYGFDDLMLILSNCAGLYYQKLNDDQTALGYFLKGIKLAEKLGDIGMAGKLNTNIGYSFARNGDLKTAHTYFQQAYQILEPHLEGDNIRIALGSLSNLAETYKYLGDTEGCRRALERCEELSEENIYSRVRMDCGWCAYYATIGDNARCIEIADRLIEQELLAVDEPFFICDMAEGLCGNMLAIHDQARVKKVLDIIQNLEYDSSLALQHRIQFVKIHYWQEYGEEDKLQQAYKEYYEIVAKMTAIEDETRAQSMISKIQISQAVQERETMQKQMQVLENASQLDELTGLYNRRYFNKLVSKTTHREDLHTLGFIMLDVDYFKQYNDFYGHFKGDDALRTVARVLSGRENEGIYVSRYGGDEFVCLCVNLSDEEMENYAKQVIHDLLLEQVPHEKHASSDVLTVSLGYCNETFYPELDAEKLLDLADKALYTVKTTVRGSYARKSFA